MKHIFLSTTLLYLLCITPVCIAQTANAKKATIKYEDGSKYIGAIRKGGPKKFRNPLIPRIFIKKEKMRHGKGIMLFSNGDQLDGTWSYNQCVRGCYKFANGDIFEGQISERLSSDGKWRALSFKEGRMIYASEGKIIIQNNKEWYYPANCCFNGTFIDNKPYSGTFDCILTSKEGNRYTGNLSRGEFQQGKLDYANGDMFEGSFIADVPLYGKYCYGKATEVATATIKWEIPAGCVFKGNLATLTGTVDMEITNAIGDKFIGSIKNGEPDKGTMFFAATGHTETGEWHDGMSPSVYLIKQEAERKRQEAERKRQEAINLQNSLKALEATKQKLIAGKSLLYSDNVCIRPKEDLWPGAVFRFSQLFLGKKISYGDNIYTCKDIRKTESGIEILCIEKDKQNILLNLNCIYMTRNPSDIKRISTNYPKNLGRVFYYAEDNNQACYLVSDQQNIPFLIKEYYIHKYGSVYGPAIYNKKVEFGMTVEMVQAIYGKGDITRHAEPGREIIVLTYGGYIFFGGYVKISSYTFVNNRLTEYQQ